MKHTYRIHIQPQAHRSLYFGGQPFSPDALASAIEGAVLRQAVQGNHGCYEVDLQLQRPTHEQALNEILVAVQQLGYSWLQATVTEWADNALGGLVLGGLGGATAGTSSAGGEAGMGFGILGAIVGMVVGSFIDSVKVVYEVHWTPTGWKLVEQQPQAVPAAAPNLGLA
jgi:hypothetical protein